MARESCPNCGTKRTGAFRFCRSCGFDFEASAAASPPPVAAPPSPVPSQPTSTPTATTSVGDAAAGTQGPDPTTSTAPPTGTAEIPTAAAPAIQATPPRRSRRAGNAPVRTVVVQVPRSSPKKDKSTDGRPSEGRPNLWLIAGVAALIGVFGFLVIGQLGRPGVGGGGTATVTANPDIPPAGTIWFAESFDQGTFEMPSRVSSASVGETIAFVGHLTAPGTGIQVRLMQGGSTVIRPNEGIPDGTDFASGTLDLRLAGPLTVELVDEGGNVLASGSLDVSS